MCAVVFFSTSWSYVAYGGGRKWTKTCRPEGCKSSDVTGGCNKIIFVKIFHILATCKMFNLIKDMMI